MTSDDFLQWPNTIFLNDQSQAPNSIQTSKEGSNTSTFHIHTENSSIWKTTHDLVLSVSQMCIHTCTEPSEASVYLVTGLSEDYAEDI